MGDTDNRIGHGRTMTDPIQVMLYEGFEPVNTPTTVGEIAAKACLEDLCKTWNTMLDADMSVPQVRIRFDVDAAIAVLQAFKRHVAGVGTPLVPLKILKGKAR